MTKRAVYRGTVVTYFPERGCGFIRPEGVNSRDVFFHLDAYCESAEIDGEIRFLIPNQDLRLHPTEDPIESERVFFMATESHRGPKATHWDFAYDEEVLANSSV